MEDQVKVTGQRWLSLLGTFLRQMTLISTSISAMVAFFGKRDIIGLVSEIGNNEFLMAVGTLLTLAVIAWGLIREWLRKTKLIDIARRAPNHIVVLVDGFWSKVFAFGRTPSS